MATDSHRVFTLQLSRVNANQHQVYEGTVYGPCLTHLPGARPACQRLTGQWRALLAMGRIVDKLSPGEPGCADGGCGLCLSLCMRWLLWFMLKLSAVSLTCQKHP